MVLPPELVVLFSEPGVIASNLISTKEHLGNEINSAIVKIRGILNDIPVITTLVELVELSVAFEILLENFEEAKSLESLQNFYYSVYLILTPLEFLRERIHNHEYNEVYLRDTLRQIIDSTKLQGVQRLHD